MQLLVLIPADMIGLPHGVEDGHDLVAHPIISSPIGGGAKLKAINQRIEVFRQEYRLQPTTILILLVDARDDLFPFIASIGLWSPREDGISLVHGSRGS